MFPQAPQLALSIARSVHPERGHQVCGEEHAQRPSPHHDPAPHAEPQPPQWLGSVIVSTHASPHRTGVASGHAQVPPRHVRPSPQGVSLGSESKTQYPPGRTQRSSAVQGSLSAHSVSVAHDRRGRHPRVGSHAEPALHRRAAGS